jgi:molecular chaperone DnaJ
VLFQQITTCPSCHGRGNIIDKPCTDCHGRDEVERAEERTLYERLRTRSEQKT